MPLSVADLQINVEVGGDAISALGNIDARLRGVGNTASQHLSSLSKGMYDSVNATKSAEGGVQAFAGKAEEAGKKAEESGGKAASSGGKYEQLGGLAEKSGTRGANGMMALAFATMNAGDTLGPFQNSMNTMMNTMFGASMLAEGWGRKMFVAGGIVSSVGAIGTAMAMQLQDSHAKLTKAIEDTGHAYNDYGAGIDWAQGKAEKLGFTNADFQAGLARTVIATGNTNTALSHMGLVMDIARSQNESLTKAGEDFAKIWAGSPMTLRKFGIEANSTGGATKNLAAATKALESAYTSYAKAQQRVTELETNAAGAKKLGASHALALKHAHEELDRATQKLTGAQDASTKATKAGSAANADAEARAQALGKRIHGTAEEMANTWGGKFRQMKAVVTDFVAHWGQSLGPLLIGAGALIQAIAALGITMAGLATAGAVIAVIAAIAALVILFFKWHEAIRIAHQLWDKLSTPLKVLVGILAVLTSALWLPGVALVAVARLIYDNFNSIVSFVIDAWNTIANAAQVAWKWISDIVGKGIQAVENWIRPKLQAIQQWWDVHGQQVRLIVERMWKGIQIIVDFVMNHIVPLIVSGHNTIMSVIRAVMNFIVPIVQTGWNIISQNITTVMAVIVSLINGAWITIQTIIQVAIDIIQGVISVFLDLVTGQWGQAWNDIKAMASSVFNDIVGGVRDWISNMVSLIVGLVQNLLELGSRAFNALWDGMKSVWSTIIGWVGDICTTLINKFGELIGMAFDIGKNIISSIGDGIKAGVGSVIDIAKNAAKSIIDGAKSMLGIGSPSTVFISIGQDTIQGYIDGLLSMVPDLTAAIDQITQDVNSQFKQQLDFWPTINAPDKFGNWMMNSLVDPFLSGNLSVDVGGGFGVTGDTQGGMNLTNIVNQNIGGSVVTEADLVRMMRQELISIGRDNGNRVFGGGMFAPA